MYKDTQQTAALHTRSKAHTYDLHTTSIYMNASIPALKRLAETSTYRDYVQYPKMIPPQHKYKVIVTCT